MTGVAENEKLRNRLRDRFREMLGADPVCNGRVSTATVEWLVDEALRACSAVERHYLEQVVR
jgi:hypothetical protein